MRLADHLAQFSVEDLRELATRRGIRLSQQVLKSRQTLLRALTPVLERHDAVYGVLYKLSHAELDVLQHCSRGQRGTGLSALCAAGKADPAAVLPVLESLRLWGLLFPEGDWEHIAVLPAVKHTLTYMAPAAAVKDGARPWQLQPPPLETAPAPCAPRPGSFERDLAEFLARVARARLKLTQAARINRRDLRAMEAAFAVQTPGYSTWLYLMAVCLGLLEGSEEGILTVSEMADAWLAQGEEIRSGAALLGWLMLRGYPESAPVDPAEADYVPLSTVVHRSRVTEAARDLPLAGEGPAAVLVSSLAAQLLWMAPLLFQQWDSLRDSNVVTARLARSLFWLGLAAVDDAEHPRHAALTPLGARVLRRDGAELPPLMPEETRFLLQPNAEAFAPPNLAPRTLFHLRRITDEKKGGAAGMYPLTPASIRRALDSGLQAGQIVTFLERFSRTGLPGNVRTLVEDAGRQHGRIRLVPAGYVLVAEDTTLMEELRRTKTVAPLLRTPLTERAATVGAEEVPELLKRLRSRGYAPVNEAEGAAGPGLPDDPERAPALPHPEESRREGGVALDWSAIGEDGEDGGAADVDAAPITDPRGIRRLIRAATEHQQEVEIQYVSARNEPTVRLIWPLFVDNQGVDAYCCLRQDERRFLFHGILWARRTGECFEVE